MSMLVKIVACVVMLVPTGSPAAPTEADVHVEVGAAPAVVATSGEVVSYYLQVVVPGQLLPVTVVSLSSELYGDVADPDNPSLLATTCSVPADYHQPTPGWLGWACHYETRVGGEPGERSDTISVLVQFGDGTEVAASGDVVVTVSDQLGVIEGTMVDADTGEPIPGIFVQGSGRGVHDAVSGFTDSSGRFQFVGLEPSVYALRSGGIRGGGWGSADPPNDYRTEYAFEYYDEEPVVSSKYDPTWITVLPAQTTEIRWELSAGGAIEGTVTSATPGQELRDLYVAFWPTEPGGSMIRLSLGGYSDVGDDGTYRLSALRSGEYVVCFFTSIADDECWDDTPYVFPGTYGDLITVELGETVVGIDAVIGAPAATVPTTPATTAPMTSPPTTVPILPATGDGAGSVELVGAVSLMAIGAMVVLLAWRPASRG